MLELLDLSGALVTIDAMGCQTDIAEQIVKHKGDYVLAVKGNQPTLLADVQEVFNNVLDQQAGSLRHEHQETTERGHGRTESRAYHAVALPRGFAKRHPESKGLRSLGMVLSERQVGTQKPSHEARFFISSLKANLRRFARAVRQHWGIENSLHWHLDITFGEDANRVAKRNAARNLALLRRQALGLLKRHPDKKSVKCKRLAAALNTAFLDEILQGAGNLDKV